MDVNLQGKFINNVWTVSLGIQKYQNNPTSTSLDTKHYSIHNVDFPGITICPNTKVSEKPRDDAMNASNVLTGVCKFVFNLQIMKSNFRAAMRTKSLPWRNLTQKMVDDGTVASAADFQVMMLMMIMINTMIMMMIDDNDDDI